MAVEPPKIDHRTSRDILQQILGEPSTGVKGLRDYYTNIPNGPNWTSRDPNDPGVVLSGLFGKLMEIVLERLNRIPEKNFIAFLDLLGMARSPGNWARAPVKFLLPAGNQTGGFVDAGTQLATGPTESGRVYIFETEKGIFITPALLAKIFSLLPATDEYADISALADTLTVADIPVLSGGRRIKHILYLAHNSLLGFSEPVQLTVDLTISPHTPLSLLAVQDWQVTWQRFIVDGAGQGHWEEMRPEVSSFPSLASQFLESGAITFNFAGTAQSIQGASAQGGGEAHWIRAILSTPLTPELPLPQIQALKLDVTINRSDLPIDAAFFNTLPIDLSKDFHPLGEEPKLADTFYLASSEAFSKPGAIITLGIALSRGIQPAPSDDLELRWECWNGERWEAVSEFSDSSKNFSVGLNSSIPGGVITFTLPNQVAPTEVNGISNYWIRVRIVQGNYGEQAEFKPVPGTSPLEYRFFPGFNPPVLSSITLAYLKIFAPQDPERLLTFNNFTYENQLRSRTTPSGAFPPFVPIPEEEPALYLGFDRAFGDVAISLFFQIAERLAAGTTTQLTSQPATGTAETAPQVVWEYANGNGGWSRLEVGDNTDHLTTAGTVSFLGPDDFSSVVQFGLNLFWLRARIQSGSIPTSRVLKGIFANTVWTANLTTIHNEVLGSGNATAHQSLVFAQKPVLAGEKLYVREPEVPSDEAKQALEAVETTQLGRVLTAAERSALVQVMTNPVTADTEIWVRWHRVDSFVGADAQSRQYILDRIIGIATFGDGKKGMIPPIGRDNIKVFFYQSGGGLQANKEVKAGVIKELRSSLPFVDKVINVVAAGGGSDPESVEDVLERGPQTIKNRDRAITIEDYVWLAKQASTQVHQVKCLPTTNAQLQFEPGAVTLLLVPDSEESRPQPSQQLIREVNDYLLERTLANLTHTPSIYIITPFYREIQVKAEVVAIIPEESSVVEARIINKINIFLHPVTGGPDSKGWEFGRNVYISEIFQLINSTEGADVVLSVELNGNPLLNEIEIEDNELPVSGIHNIIMKSGV